MDNEKMDGLSMDIELAEQNKLRSLFPQCFTDGKLDVTKLLAVCGQFETADENDREKYEFRWKGKQECLQLAGKRSSGTLRPCPEESVNFDETQNIYIEGDNLEVLKILQTAYYRKVKMIYIDPPYNTGNDFVYEDDFADPISRYKEVTEQTTKSNPETMGRFHTNWLNMMYPRLRLAANLLRDDGVIFISIDDNEVHNLRKVCDEVFGEENFVALLSIIVKPEGRRYGFFAKTHENILIYCKKISEAIFNEIQVDGATYQYSDEKGGFNLKGLRNRNVQAFNSTNRPNLRYPFYVDINNPDKNGLFPVSVENKEGFIKVMPSTVGELKSVWRWGKDKSSVEFESLTAYHGKDNELRIYQKERKLTQTAKTVWQDKNIISNKGTKELIDLIGKGIFDFPKPLQLIKAIVEIGTSPDDIILDFFSGSATTAHAVMQLNAEDGGNRKFICVQLPELCDEKSEAFKAGYKNICEIGKERIRRAGSKIKEFQARSVIFETGLSLFEDKVDFEYPINPELEIEKYENLDVGFKVFKLDTSNLKLWDDSPIVGENALVELEMRIRGMLDIIKPDRSNMDVVYEVMLKLGQELTAPIIPIDLGEDKTVYGVGTGDGAEVKFIVCLAAGITPEDAKEMAEYAPGRIVFADACFAGSEQKSNVRLTLKDKGIAIKTL